MLDLVPCDFILFPQLKMKLKGRHFETVSDIQRKSQAILKSMRKTNGITVYVLKETNLKEMANTIKFSQHFFFDLVWELSDTLLHK
jgi:ADP-heptose:LPS heptosyltransferase